MEDNIIIPLNVVSIKDKLYTRIPRKKELLTNYEKIDEKLYDRLLVTDMNSKVIDNNELLNDAIRLNPEYENDSVYETLFKVILDQIRYKIYIRVI